jgi:hypothetical protein
MRSDIKPWALAALEEALVRNQVDAVTLTHTESFDVGAVSAFRPTWLLRTSPSAEGPEAELESSPVF